jgi:hypothetical protein
VPRTLTSRDNSSIGLSCATSNVDPEQPLACDIGATAPDFNEDLYVHYPDPGSASKTYVLKTASLKDYKEFTITVSFVSSSVTYTYRRE